MTSGFARLSALLSAIVALTCTILWLANGAPVTGSLSGILAHASGEDPRVRIGLILATLQVVTAASLSLLILVRGTRSAKIDYIGTGFGWNSISVSYLLLISIVPFFHLGSSHYLSYTLALDLGIFGVLLLDLYAFIQFFKVFPSPITASELSDFLNKERALKLERSTTSRHLNWIVARLRWGPPSVNPVRDGERSFLIRVIFDPSRGQITLVIAITLLGALAWHGIAFVQSGGAMSGLAIVIIGMLIMLFGLATVSAVRICRFHRALGSKEDKRKIEWLWTAFFVSQYVVLTMLVVLAIGVIAERYYPVLSRLSFEYWIIPAPIYAFILTPFVVHTAVGASIALRGVIDSKLALRGFTVWTLLGIVLTLVFVLVERTVALRAVAWLNLPPQSGMVAAGAIVAATFQPIRRRLESYVNRFVERVLPTTILASGERHTLAVTVVDISAYSALSAEDEQGALLASAFVQKECRRLAGKFGGRVAKTTGDGAIMCFDVSQRALDAVLELHRAIVASRTTLNLPALDLHSGLHWGEVVQMHDGDIYGQTVNVTVRIADWAKAGEIGMSEALYEQLQTKPPGFQSMGAQSFKNIPQPVACLKLVSG